MVTWPHLRLDRPKGPRWAWLLGLPFAVGALGATGCALIGYGFDGYGGAGGATGSSSQGSGGQGGAGSAGHGGGVTVSSSTGTGRPCTLPSDCNDQDACTADICELGVCSNALLPVDDENPCTIDSCNIDKGVSHLLQTCDDGNPCTSDSCDTKSGACDYTPLPTMDDGDGCTSDVCDPGTGATVHVPIASCCPHSVCAAGAVLDPASCGSAGFGGDCIEFVCANVPSCCSMSWSAACAAVVPVFCNSAMGKYSCACSHSYCAVGAALSPSCDPCVQAVCADPDTKYCCDPNAGLGWNASCVAQTHNLCNVPLGAGCK